MILKKSLNSADTNSCQKQSGDFINLVVFFLTEIQKSCGKHRKRSIGQKRSEDFVKFSGLFKKHKLYNSVDYRSFWADLFGKTLVLVDSTEPEILCLDLLGKALVLVNPIELEIFWPDLLG